MGSGRLCRRRRDSSRRRPGARGRIAAALGGGPLRPIRAPTSSGRKPMPSRGRDGGKSMSSSRSTAISPICRRSNSFLATISRGSPRSRRRTGEVRRELQSLLDAKANRDSGPISPSIREIRSTNGPSSTIPRKWSAWFFWEDGARNDRTAPLPGDGGLARRPATARPARQGADGDVLDPRAAQPDPAPHRLEQCARDHPSAAHRSGRMRLPGRLADEDLRSRAGLGVRRHDRARSLERERRDTRRS